MTAMGSVARSSHYIMRRSRICRELREPHENQVALILSATCKALIKSVSRAEQARERSADSECKCRVANAVNAAAQSLPKDLSMFQWGIQLEESAEMLCASLFAVSELPPLAGVSSRGAGSALPNAAAQSLPKDLSMSQWGIQLGESARMLCASFFANSELPPLAGVSSRGAASALSTEAAVPNNAAGAASALPTETAVPNNAALALTTCASKEIFVQIFFSGSTAK
eukprot:CAMPEP_0183486478 /NCGR_PEP_ID=MMETSP0370-20130417/179957_1 /TAXON_ID=268820 /ORGANISM="Peridinium aciculiferum, Strain PAER-2" /LENGTH=226 /DNA_ID=CAMNT_0025679797 /DNA_START=59 /DNA_END=736 /DNA_ORIENTATION=+